MSPKPYDVLVIGGGPAGLAAGVEAANEGLFVAIVDERPTPGGQIFKQPGAGFRITSPDDLGRDFVRGRVLIDQVERSGAELLLRTSAVSIAGPSVVLVTEGEHAREVEAQRVVVAAGAHDRPVVFPGWTLPGVITAGGAQSLVKTQRILPGRAIVFAGSGPLALAFPAQLRGYGTNVTLVLEAGPAPRPGDLLRLVRAARGNVGLLSDALGYRTRLLRERVPLRFRRVVVRAEGDGRVEQVVHSAVDGAWRPVAGTEETVAADALCVGYGFVPSVELLRLAGCDFTYDEDLGGPVVVRDAWMRTTVDGISAAGDGTGVAGSYVAVDEGRLAALGALVDLAAISAAEALARAARPRERLRRKDAFRRALAPLHRVGAGVYELAAPETIVCRCEEVRAEVVARAVEATRDVDLVKSLTRAGMGLCQGRNCQRQVAAMIARRHRCDIADVTMGTPRAPLRPVPMAALADASVADGGFFTVAG